MPAVIKAGNILKLPLSCQKYPIRKKAIIARINRNIATPVPLSAITTRTCEAITTMTAIASKVNIKSIVLMYHTMLNKSSTLLLLWCL